jgi:hypothetical protein
MSAATTRQPADACSRNTSPKDQTSLNGHSSINPVTKNAQSITSAQSAQNVTNKYLRLPRTQQHQQQQPQNRRVSFADTSTDGSRSNADESMQEAVTKAESEDNFDFGDDEIFFAAMDMEEGDLGRPIETEADMGPPLDLEDSLLPPDGETSIDVSNVSTADVSMSNLPRNDKAVKLQRLQQEILKADLIYGPLQTSSSVQKSTSTKQSQNTSLSSSGCTSLGDSRSTAPRPFNGLNQSHQPDQLMHIQQRNHRPVAKPPPNINHENPNPAISNSGESGSKRPRTPSMGGFHFPPQMVSIWIYLLESKHYGSHN